MQPDDEWLPTDTAAMVHGLYSQLGQKDIRQVIGIIIFAWNDRVEATEDGVPQKAL